VIRFSGFREDCSQWSKSVSLNFDNTSLWMLINGLFSVCRFRFFGDSPRNDVLCEMSAW
jgi:hypothetical protein